MVPSITGRWIAAKSERSLALALAILLLIAPCAPARSGTLDTVLKRQRLICGVNPGLPGFAAKDAAGKWSGFDVDFCRAVSAAIFGDPDRVDYVPLSADERFDALRGAKIDLLSRNSTWTMSRDIGLQLEFAGVYYYDGQSFLVPAERGRVSAMELSKAKVCVQSGTTSEVNAKAYLDQAKLDSALIKFSTFDEMLAAYRDGNCDTMTADRSALAAQRLALDRPEEHTLLPEVISKEPLGPVVRKDDGAWAGVVRWVLFALINAEESGHARSSPPKAEAIATVPELGSGLPNDWYPNLVRLVGNYGEIFDRNLGKDTPLGIDRGVNALWTQGGILYAPPLR